MYMGGRRVVWEGVSGFLLSYGVINMALLIAHSDLPGLSHSMQVKWTSLCEQGRYLFL